MEIRHLRSWSKLASHGESLVHHCLCHELKGSINKEVSITTRTGDVITGRLKSVKKCVVKVLVPGSVSPFVPSRETFIRCQDIESFSVDLA